MKAKIKEIQDYFIGKMLNNEMEVSDIEEHTLKVLIDGEYIFKIWISNTKDSRTPYNTHGDNFMNLTVTQKQAHKLDAILSPIIKEYRENAGLRIKQKQFNQLKKELGII